MLGVILGGRVGYCLVYGWDQLTSDPLYLFKITEGGMSFHGGLVGVMMRDVVVRPQARQKTVADVSISSRRWCRSASAPGGSATSSTASCGASRPSVPWGVLYNGAVLHPSQLYEAVLEGLLLFVILWWYSAKPRPYMAVSGTVPALLRHAFASSSSSTACRMRISATC